MNRKDVLAMPPGPQMDAAVAEHVLGCRVVWVRSVDEQLDSITLGSYPACGCEKRGAGIRPHGYTPEWRLHAYSEGEGFYVLLNKLRELSVHGVMAWDSDGWKVGEPPPCDSYACLEFGSGAERSIAEPQTDVLLPAAMCRAALLAALANAEWDAFNAKWAQE